MRKNFFTLLTVCAAMMTFMITGCGPSGSATSSSPASATKVFGVASLGTTATTAVSVKDSSVPPQEKAAALSSDGTFTADVSRLRAPFVLKATGTDQTGASLTLSSVSTNGGMANINEISDLAATAAASSTTTAGQTIMAAYDSWSSHDNNETTAYSFDKLISSLRTVLAPLFSLYQVSGNAVSDDDESDYNGLSAMLHDVRFTMNDGKVLVTNRATGGIIFSGSLNDLSAGTFNPQNMPAGPGGSGSTACTYAYSGWGTCNSTGNQTRTVTSSSPAGCTGTPVLSQTCTYVPPTPSPCTYTYGAWGACQSTNVQIRGLLSSSPAGCTGTPVLSQACTYVPPVTTCTSFTYSGWGTCQSNNTQTRTVASSSPAGCTGGTPVLSQSCTYVPPVTTCTSFTYSGWGTCQSNSTQTRTVATSSPAGCTGGTPVLSQACVYTPPVSTLTFAQVQATCTACHGLTVNGTVFASGGHTVTGRTASAWVSAITGMFNPPSGTTVQDFANFLAALPSTTTPPAACTYTYNAWGACQSNNTQTRTVLTTSPAGCTGTPLVSQTCTYVPPAPGACTYTYNAWGACQSNSTQTRTVATSTPTGCTGTPALSQSCVYTPPVSTLTFAQVQATCTACHGLTVNTTVFASGGHTVTGRTASAWVSAITGMFNPPSGTTVQDFANFLAALP